MGSKESGKHSTRSASTSREGASSARRARIPASVGIFSVLSVLVAVGSLAFYFISSGQEELKGGSPESPRESSSRPPSPYPSIPPDGGAVRVVDKGFTPVFKRDGDFMTSYGVVLENTSDFVARGIQIKIQLLDSSGKVIRDSSAPKRSVAENRGIRYIPPGVKDGISSIVYLPKSDVARLKVDVDVDFWWAADDDIPEEFPDVEVSDVKLERTSHDDGLATFTVDVTRASSVYFCVEVILRDAKGRIVGGASPTKVTPEYLPEGRSAAEADLRWLPPRTDGERFDVYATPGCLS